MENVTYYVGLRIYRESNWGKRKLGTGRYALDMGRVSLLFERYYFD